MYLYVLTRRTHLYQISTTITVARVFKLDFQYYQTIAYKKIIKKLMKPGVCQNLYSIPAQVQSPTVVKSPTNMLFSLRFLITQDHIK